jgi:hypothetical protein
MLVSPKPVVFQRLQQLQRERDKAREKGEIHPSERQSLEVTEEQLNEPDDDDDDDDDDEDDVEGEDAAEAEKS